MEKIVKNEDGTIDIPLNEELNVVISQNESGTMFEIQKVLLEIDNDILRVYKVDEPYIISHKDCVECGQQFLVMSDKGLESPQNYQLLEYDWYKGFTTNGIDFHY